MSAKPIVVQSEQLSDEAAQWLAQRCQLIVCPYDDPKFNQALAQAHGLVVRTYTIIDDALLDQAPNLRVIGRAGAGLDNVDVSACQRRNIEIVYTPDANTQAVVEYVLCLLCDALRPRRVLDQPVDAAQWNRLRQTTFATRQMNELTLGILGLGRVGRRVAEVARSIGFIVLFNDIREIPNAERAGADAVAVDALFAQSDVISIHIDGRPSNRAFVNERLIGRMKGDALFINTSRGFVVDNLSLAKFLRTHPQALAMLDVHEPEPFGADYPLLNLPNARLYPHLASRTQTALRNMSWVVRDVWAALERSKAR